MADEPRHDHDKLDTRTLDETSFRRAVAVLCAADPDLRRAVEATGEPDFWHRTPGFSTLVLFILEQQVSLASAKAAFDRLSERVGGEVTPAAILASSDEDLRADGFSRQKTRYARVLGERVVDGTLDLSGLDRLPDEEVHRRLTSLPGIGPWTADVYLLSCLRRPDIWPTGDRALQVAAGEVLGLYEPPDPRLLGGIGERWRPHRSSAARVLWHAYLVRRGRAAGAPL